MKTNLSILYNDELWFQIGELIQELIILVKNCFFIENNEKINIWVLFGRDLFKFFKKFTDFEKEILPKTSSAIFAIGATRFQNSYNEDKLLLIEEELSKNISLFGNNLAVILFLRELTPLYSTLYDENLIRIFILNRILIKKIIFSNRIKKLLAIFSQIFFSWFKIKAFKKKSNLRMAYKKSKLNSACKNNFFSPYSKLFNFLEKTNYLSSSKVNTWPSTSLRFILISHQCLPKMLQLDKEDWFFNHSYKTLKYKTIKHIFVQNQVNGKKTYNSSNVYDQFFSKIYALSNKINFRWSKLSKQLNGNKVFVEKLVQYNLYRISNKLVMSQERQIISINKVSYFGNLLKNEISENFSFDIQKTLNKLWEVKKKTKHNNSYIPKLKLIPVK